MRDLTIVTDEGSKGRSFRATLLAHATSRSLWAGGTHDNLRPIWAMIATTDAESLPFIRNLQCGRKANCFGDGNRDKASTFELLKSAGYEYQAQRHPEGVVWTCFLPELFRIDAGMSDPEGVKFAMLPAAGWLADEDHATAKWLAGLYREEAGDWYGAEKRQAESDAKRLSEMLYLTRVSGLFAARLNSRTRCPLIPDPRFYSLILAALLNSGQAGLAGVESYTRESWGRLGSFREEGLQAVGIAPGVVCETAHVQLEPVLAACVKTYESTR